MAKARKTVSPKNSFNLIILALLALVLVLGAYVLNQNQLFSSMPRASEQTVNQTNSCGEFKDLEISGVKNQITNGYCHGTTAYITFTCVDQEKRMSYPLPEVITFGPNFSAECSLWEELSYCSVRLPKCYASDSEELKEKLSQVARYVCGCFKIEQITKTPAEPIRLPSR